MRRSSPTVREGLVAGFQIQNMKTQSIYMQWAKNRPKVKYVLGLSGILNLPFAYLEA
jgi:hypothetical protein